MRFFRKTRYYYWLASGFLRKYARIVVVVCVIAFFGLLFFRSFVDSFTSLISFNKRNIGLVALAGRERIPTEILPLVSSGIVTYDEKGVVRKQLAKKWEMKGKGTEFIFEFPSNLRWQDGKVFDTADINPKSLNLFQVKTEKLSPTKIRFLLNKDEPLVNFPTLLTLPLLRDNLVGIGGKYEIARVRYDFGQIDWIKLNPTTRDLPILTYKLYNSQDEVALAYKLGEIDQFDTTDPEVAATFKKWKNSNIQEHVDYKKMVTLFINTQEPPFDNRTVRQAVAMALNYPKLEKYGERAYSPILPFSWAYDPKVTTYSYEPEISKSLVEKQSEANTPVTLYTSYDLNIIAEEAAKSLRAAGFRVEVRYASYIPTDYSLFLTMWEPPIDPDQYVFWHQKQTGSNLSKLKNVRIDKLLEDGRRNELSATERKQIYFKFQEIITDEVPAVFLYYPKLYTISH